MKIKLLTDGGYVDLDGKPLIRLIGGVFEVDTYIPEEEGSGPPLAGVKPFKGARLFGQIPLYFSIPSEAVIIEE